MGRRSSSYDSGVRERSGWLVPSGFLLAIIILCIVFLLYYLLPNPASFIEEHTSPTPRTNSVHLTVGGLALNIPANYLLYPSARTGGARREVAVFAALPDFRGYSDPDSGVFSGNGAKSPIVHIVIRQNEFELAEPARLARIYLNHVVDPHGKPGPFGLTQYSFGDESGYRGEDLLVGQIEQGVVVMHCVRRGATVASPNCLREMPLTKGVALNYRFKRSRLASWREIARGVGRLVASFTAAAK